MRNPNVALRTVVLFSAIALYLAVVALVHPETWYLIPEPELSRLETISQTYKTDRQKSLSQVQKLKSEAVQLKADSVILNGLLSQERKSIQTLRLSFELYVQENYRMFQSKQTEITDLTKDVSDITLKNQKKITVIVILSSILAVIIAGIAILLYFKSKNIFSIFKPG